MRNLTRLFSCLALAFVAVSVVAGLFDWQAVCAFLFGQEGGSLCAAVGGVVGAWTIVEGGVSHQSTELDENGNPKGIHDLDLDAVVVKVRPSETPMDTLMRELKNTRKSASINTGGWEVGTRDVEDKVTVALTGSSDVHDITVGLKNMWMKDDTILVPGVNGGDGKPLMLYVLGKDNTNSRLNVVAANPVDNKIPSIPANAVLLRLGNAKAETDAQTTPFALQPTPRYNYCQIHMCQVEESVVESLAKKKVAMDFSTYKEQTMWDWKRAMEYTNLFGVKSVITNPNDGKQDLAFAAVVVGKYVFCHIHESGLVECHRRVELPRLVDLIERMSYVKEFQQQINPENVEVVHGIRFQRIVTNFGELLVKSHKLFRGQFADSALVLDMSYVTKDVYEPLHTKALNLDESGQKRVMAHRMIENYCLYAENLPTHCKIRKKA